MDEHTNPNDYLDEDERAFTKAMMDLEEREVPANVEVSITTTSTAITPTGEARPAKRRLDEVSGGSSNSDDENPPPQPNPHSIRGLEPMFDLTLDETQPTGKTFEQLSPGAKLLACAHSLGMEYEAASSFFNLLSRIRRDGINDRELKKFANRFNFIETNESHIAELSTFNNYVPPIESNSTKADPRMDLIIFVQENAVQILCQLSKFVSQVERHRNTIEIKIKGISKPVVVRSSLFPSGPVYNSEAPPVDEVSINNMTTVFSNLKTGESFIYLSMLHEFAGIFPDPVSSKDGSDSSRRDFKVPYKYTQPNFTKFLDQIDERYRPRLPHQALWSAVSQYIRIHKLESVFYSMPGDTLLGPLFLPVKISRALSDLSANIAKKLFEFSVDVRKSLFNKYRLEVPSGRALDRDELLVLRDEVTRAIEMIGVDDKGKQTFIDIVMNLGKAAMYSNMLFHFKLDILFKKCHKEVQDGQGRKSVYDDRLFRKLITKTDSITEQMFTISEYDKRIDELVRKQDILTPLGTVTGLGKSNVLKAKCQKSFKEYFEKVNAHNSIEKNPKIEPVVIASKKIFQQHVDQLVPFPYFKSSNLPGITNKNVRKILVTSTKSDHQNDVYSFNNSSSMLVQLRSNIFDAMRPYRNEKGEPNGAGKVVVVLCTYGISDKYVKMLLHKCAIDEQVVDFHIISKVGDLSNRSAPFIYHAPGEFHFFPSADNCEILDMPDASGRPIVSFSMRKVKASGFDWLTPKTNPAYPSALIRVYKNNYFKLLVLTSQMFKRKLSYIGYKTEDAERPDSFKGFISEDIYLDMLQTALAKSFDESHELEAEHSALMQDAIYENISSEMDGGIEDYEY
jgi:hypothetical protein